MKPHKHAELIKAWADGAEIERLTEIGDWLPDNDTPEWLEDVVYRIKPAEKVARWLWAYKNFDLWMLTDTFMSEEELQAWEAKSPYEGFVKVEATRMEFDE